MTGTEVATRDLRGDGRIVVLRRQPAHIVQGRVEGGYNEVYELICGDCGDHPDLDYREISPGLRQVRGPYPIAVGVVAYRNHVKLHQEAADASPGAQTGRVRP